jgi:release factor glutamine methyltransferase
VTDLTFAEAINKAAKELHAAGIDDARYEARNLFLLIADFSSTDLISAETRVIPNELEISYTHAIHRRCGGEPFQHIVGTTEFFGLSLKTDARALIPRPDSECVVELALEQLNHEHNGKVADLGTGTGALLSAILYNHPNSLGIAIERSSRAASLATENLKALGLGERSEILNISWTEWSGWGDCDLIISNPPYIESAIIPTLQPEVRDHDPMDALDGGADGLDAYREIISLGAKHMKSDACLVLEIGYDQKVAVTDLLSSAGFIQIQHRKDLGGNDRAIAAKRP